MNRLLCCLLLTILLPLPAWALEEDGTIVLTAEEIGRMKAHKMADLLNQVAGVSAGDSSVSIHGSYKVKVLVDGRPINDPTSSHGGINWNLVRPEQVARIEILRGKGGVRYGQDASGGVILITTKAIDAVSGRIKAYGGNLDTGFTSAQAQARSGAWTAEMSGEHEFTQGYSDNNDKHRTKVGSRLGYAWATERSLNLGADYLYDKRGLTGLPDYPTPFARKKSTTTALSAQARYDQFSSSTFYNAGSRTNEDVSRGIDQLLRVNELGEDLSSELQTGDWGQLSYGAGYRLNTATGTGFDDQNEETFSLFASQNLHRSGSPWLFTAGLRANANTAFDDVLNPELKAVYKQQHWSLTAAYSSTNNTPSFYQRYNLSSSTEPNPELDMETADNYSLTLGLEPWNVLSAQLSLFYNKITDRITYVTGDDGIGQYQNFGEVSYKGGDVSLTWKPWAELSIKPGYTYLRAIDEETDLFIPAKAEHTVNLECSWQVSERLMTILNAKYVSSVYRNKANTTSVPEYTLVDLRAEYELDAWSVFTEIENLANATYYYADGLLGPPRTWILGLSWKF